MTSRSPTVAIKKIASPIGQETILLAVRDAVSLACGSEPVVRRGASVVIKPNVFAPLPPPATTDPRVTVALVRLVLEAGAREAIVAEGRSISTAKFRKSHNSTSACAELIGMTEAVESAGGRMVYLEEDEFAEVEVPGGLVLKKAHVPRTILDADVLINVPALKIHSLTCVTLGIKNLHGLLSDEDKLFGHSYRELPAKLTDFLRIRRPDLTVIDGIVGQEGDHADEGRPVPMGLIVAGRDVVAVDSVTSAVMGFDPFEVDVTRIAAEYGLGEADLRSIQVLGESIEAVRRPFARPDIGLDTERFPGLRVIAGDYCRSCEYYARRGLDKLLDAGYFGTSNAEPSIPESQTIRNELTIILGKEPPVPDELPGGVIMLGDCCLSSQSVRRLRDHLLLDGRLQVLYACPPMEFRIRALEMVHHPIRAWRTM